MKDKQVNQTGKAVFTVTNGTDPAFVFKFCGRDRRALECLIDAGEAGRIPIDTPGPRWSGYVYNLRQMGADKRPAPRTAAIRRVMHKHGLPEAKAQLVAHLACGEGLR